MNVFTFFMVIEIVLLINNTFFGGFDLVSSTWVGFSSLIEIALLNQTVNIALFLLPLKTS